MLGSKAVPAPDAPSIGTDLYVALRRGSLSPPLVNPAVDEEDNDPHQLCAAFSGWANPSASAAHRIDAAMLRGGALQEAGAETGSPVWESIHQL